jgi:hypothetical protein
MRLRGGSSVDVPADGTQGWVSARTLLFAPAFAKHTISGTQCLPMQHSSHFLLLICKDRIGEKKRLWGVAVLSLSSAPIRTGVSRTTFHHSQHHTHPFFGTFVACVCLPVLFSFQGVSTPSIECQHGLHQDHVEKGTQLAEESRGAHL